jgi:hypothetical protein
MFSWATLSEEYAKLKEGAIGSDEFPGYRITIRTNNDDGTMGSKVLFAGENAEVQHVEVEGKTAAIWITAPADGAFIYQNEAPITKNPITLNKGSNLIGVGGMGTVNGKSKWLGFDWIDITYKPSTTTAIPAGQHYTARGYTFINSMYGKDAECTAAFGSYYTDDPYCSIKGTYAREMTCGRPPEKCLDKTHNKNGLAFERQYYLIEKTANDGAKHMDRVFDGIWKTYNDDGSVQINTDKDGVTLPQK